MKLYDDLWLNQQRPAKVLRQMELPLTPPSIPEKPCNLTSVDDVMEFKRQEEEIRAAIQMRSQPEAIIREVDEVMRQVASMDLEKQDYDGRSGDVVVCEENLVAELHPSPEATTFTGVDRQDASYDRIGWHYCRDGPKEVYEKIRSPYGSPCWAERWQVICDRAKGTLTYVEDRLV